MKPPSWCALPLLLFPLLPSLAEDCPGEFAELGSAGNVTRVDFVKRRVMRSETELKGDSVVVPLPSIRKTAQALPARAQQDAEAAEKTVKAWADLETLARNADTQGAKLNQNQVWTLHANHTILSENAAYLLNKAHLTASQKRELQEAVERGQNALEESQLFRKLEARGLSLIPKPDQRILQALPDELREGVKTLPIHEAFLNIELSHLRGMNSIYSDEFRRNLLNGGIRRRLSEEIRRHFEVHLQILDRLLSSVPRSKLEDYDLEELNRTMSSAVALAESPTITGILEANQKSYFKAARDQAEAAKSTIARFLSRYRQELQPRSARLKLVGANDKARPSGPMGLEELKPMAERITTAMSRSEDPLGAIPQHAREIRELKTRLFQSQEKPTEAQILDYLAYILKTAETPLKEAPKKASVLSSSSRRSQIESANQLRTDIQEIREWLSR